MNSLILIIILVIVIISLAYIVLYYTKLFGSSYCSRSPNMKSNIGNFYFDIIDIRNLAKYDTEFNYENVAIQSTLLNYIDSRQIYDKDSKYRTKETIKELLLTETSNTQPITSHDIPNIYKRGRNNFYVDKNSCYTYDITKFTERQHGIFYFVHVSFEPHEHHKIINKTIKPRAYVLTYNCVVDNSTIKLLSLRSARPPVDIEYVYPINIKNPQIILRLSKYGRVDPLPKNEDSSDFSTDYISSTSSKFINSIFMRYHSGNQMDLKFDLCPADMLEGKNKYLDTTLSKIRYDYRDINMFDWSDNIESWEYLASFAIYKSKMDKLSCINCVKYDFGGNKEHNIFNIQPAVIYATDPYRKVSDEIDAKTIRDQVNVHVIKAHNSNPYTMEKHIDKSIETLRESAYNNDYEAMKYYVYLKLSNPDFDKFRRIGRLGRINKIGDFVSSGKSSHDEVKIIKDNDNENERTYKLDINSNPKIVNSGLKYISDYNFESFVLDNLDNIDSEIKKLLMKYSSNKCIESIILKLRKVHRM